MPSTYLRILSFSRNVLQNKHTSLFGLFVGDREKCLIILTLEVNLLKMSSFKVVYPDLTFTGKARSLP